MPTRTPTPTPTLTPTIVISACNDGQDNDGDGSIDLLDLGCKDRDDLDETDPCTNYPMYFSVHSDVTPTYFPGRPWTENKSAFLYECCSGIVPSIGCPGGALTCEVAEIHNGGIPQEVVFNPARLEEHHSRLARYLDEVAPDILYDGILILDLESWGPHYHRLYNHPGPVNYRSLSEARIRNRPGGSTLTDDEVAAAAEEEWNQASRLWITLTLDRIRELRPRARLAMYGYPATYTLDWIDGYTSPMGNERRAENDAISEIWSRLDIFAPVIYFQTNSGFVWPGCPGGDTNPGCIQTVEVNQVPMRTGLIESRRLSRAFPRRPILAIAWHRYLDNIPNLPSYGQLMTGAHASDLSEQFITPYYLGYNGVINWGNERGGWFPAYQEFMNSTFIPLMRNFCAESPSR